MKRLSLRLRVLRTMDAIASQMPTALVRQPRNEAGVALSPFLQCLRYLRRLTAPRGANADSAQALREQFRQDMKALRIGFPVRAVENFTLPGAAGPLQARCYQPAVTNALPVLLVYFHGGGFIMGDLDTHDDACRLLCQESSMPVLAVDYRLAPEHPFPAAVEDAEAAVRWALANSKRFGVQAIAVGGDSAGANLAAVTAQSLAKAGPALLAQLLIYPSTDRATARPSHQRFGRGYFLDHADRELFYRSYLAGRPLETDPRVSPLLNRDPGVLAPAVLVTAGFDMLRDEGEAYADHLRRSGSKVELMRFEPLGHGFINLAGVHAESKLALFQIAAQWRQHCRQQLTHTGEQP